jgi:hypothetical protein
MPIIEADHKGKTTKLQLELDRETNATLNKYIRYCRADKNKVLIGALKLLFKEDKDFALWLEKHPPRKRASTLAGTTSRSSTAAPPSSE